MNEEVCETVTEQECTTVEEESCLPSYKQECTDIQELEVFSMIDSWTDIDYREIQRYDR